MVHMLIIIAYILGVIAFGLYVSKKKVKNAEDMVVGGRQLPMIVLVGTLLATWCGGGGITGSASVVYSGGPGVGTLHFIGAPIGILLLYFIAGKVRKTEKITIPEILEEKYGKLAAILGVACIVLAYVGIVATQTKAAANIINLLTGIDLTTGMIIAAVIIILLTVTGGMVSVAYTDALSAFLMVGGFLLAVPVLFKAAGGAAAVGAGLEAVGKHTLTGGLSPIVIVGYMVPTIALLLGDQNMMQRFASAKDEGTAKKSNMGMFVAEVVVCALIILVVTAGIVLEPEVEVSANIIFILAQKYLPTLIGGLVLAACVAFIITTANSFLLSATTNLTYDIWKRYMKKDATDKQEVTFLRVTMVILAIFAVALTLFLPDLLTLQLTAYTMYGATITPALLFALFSKKVTKPAGVAGIVVGAVVTALWSLQNVAASGLLNLGFATLTFPVGIQPAVIAVPLAVVAILLTTLVTKKKEN